ncbi:DUF1570 domain-containing protein [Candidatus Omnitrophota bacterium]
MILFLALSAPASPAKEDWRTRNSYHFVIYYKQNNFRYLDRLVNKAEDSYRLITQGLGFTRDKPWIWDERAAIYVYGTKEEFLATADVPEWSAGYARPFAKEIHTYNDSNDFLDHIIVHELTHIIFREFVGNSDVPVWLDEGLATYMERKQYVVQLKNKTGYFLKHDQFIDFERFLAMDRGELGGEVKPEDEIKGTSFPERFYLQAYSLVYFLFNEFPKYKFVEFLRKVKKEGSFDAAFYKVYWALRDNAGLEARWRKYYD